MEYCVYEHLFPNGKRYIGITKDVEQRWGFKGAQYSNQTKIANAINKYGWENIEHNIIKDGLSKNDAEKLEIELIKEFDSINNGYNVAIGGNIAVSTYLNKTLSSMILKAKKYIESFGVEFKDGQMCFIVNALKSDYKSAMLFNEIDDLLHGFYNRWKQWGGELSILFYWIDFIQIFHFGRPKTIYEEIRYKQIQNNESLLYIDDNRELLETAYGTKDLPTFSRPFTCSIDEKLSNA